MEIGVSVAVGEVSVGVAIGGTRIGVAVDESGTNAMANGTGVDVAVGNGVGVALGVWASNTASIATTTACCTDGVGVSVGGTAAIPGGVGSDEEVYEVSSSSRRSALMKTPTPTMARRRMMTNQSPPLPRPDEARRDCLAPLRFLPRLPACSDRNWRKRLSTHAAQVQAGGWSECQFRLSGIPPTPEHPLSRPRPPTCSTYRQGQASSSCPLPARSGRRGLSPQRRPSRP